MIEIQNMIPDADTAIKVASALLEAYMGEARFKRVREEMPLIASMQGNVWTVYTHTPVEEGKDGTSHITFGGGGPCIELSKDDARVLRVYFQK